MPFQSILFSKFSSREHAPRLPSLTCLEHAVEHYIKEIICDLKPHIKSMLKKVVCMTMTSVAVHDGLITQNISVVV